VHDERALQQIELPRGAKLKRYKGLGEMNPAELWTSTMDPELQNKFAVSVSAFEEGRADELVATLMGKQVEGRKRFILENYSKVENLDI